MACARCRRGARHRAAFRVAAIAGSWGSDSFERTRRALLLEGDDPTALEAAIWLG